MPRVILVHLSTPFTNTGARSERSFTGGPKIDTQPETNASAHVRAASFFIGTATTNLENRSTIISSLQNPSFVAGVIVVTSIDTYSNRWWASIGCIEACGTCSGYCRSCPRRRSLMMAQVAHLPTKAATSTRRPVQENRRRIRAVTRSQPKCPWMLGPCKYAMRLFRSRGGTQITSRPSGASMSRSPSSVVLCSTPSAESSSFVAFANVCSEGSETRRLRSKASSRASMDSLGFSLRLFNASAVSTAGLSRLSKSATSFSGPGTYPTIKLKPWSSMIHLATRPFGSFRTKSH
mmetsp:Transcript_21434/g.57248  ORF Transcript_21434/g.57248 Transcript_21434/m.57248 type:complete len:292 (+) Transcript_21434:1475-2350(+)